MRKELRLLPLVATIYFCVSGGPFGLEPVMKGGAGLGLLLIVVTPLLWAIPAALMTAELAAAMPAEGGYYVWVKRAFGDRGGFLCAWWSWLYSWVDVAIYPTLFASYLHRLIEQLHGHSVIESNPWVKWLVGLCVIIPFTYLNIRGVREVGWVSTLFVVLLTIPFALMVGVGASTVVHQPHLELLAPKATLSSSIGAGLFVVMWNYLGWDSMSTVAAEVENPQRNFPKALAICVPLIVLSYLLPAIVGVAALPDLSKWNEGAWTEAAAHIGGNGLAILITLAGLIGTCGLFVSTLLAGSRIPMVLAEDGYLPQGLKRLHPRFGTPVNAILVSALFYSIFSYSTFQDLTSFDVLLYSAGLLLELAALIALRRNEPDLVRPFKIPGGIPTVCFLAALPLVLILFACRMEYLSDEGGVRFLVLGGVALLSGWLVYPLRKVR